MSCFFKSHINGRFEGRPTNQSGQIWWRILEPSFLRTCQLRTKYAYSEVWLRKREVSIQDAAKIVRTRKDTFRSLFMRYGMNLPGKAGRPIKAVPAKTQQTIIDLREKFSVGCHRCARVLRSDWDARAVYEWEGFWTKLADYKAGTEHCEVCRGALAHRLALSG